jgi:glutamate synthase (NADPH/NADH) small chain
MKLDPKLSIDGVRRAVVIGGGNTALDAARELAQLGVEEVKLVYRRSEEEMSGYRHEWNEAKKEGVVLVPNAIVKSVVRKTSSDARSIAKARNSNESVVALELVRAKRGKATKLDLAPLAIDLVIVAIGQAKLAALAQQFRGVEVDDSGCFVADPATGRTGNPRVFTGGDAMNGGKEVVNAAAEGQNAARAMNAVLSSKRKR